MRCTWCAHVDSSPVLLCSLQEDPSLRFFKTTWRYNCFITDGVLDGLPALLTFVRREAKLKLKREQKEAQRRREIEQAQAERRFYLEDRYLLAVMWCVRVCVYCRELLRLSLSTNCKCRFTLPHPLAPCLQPECSGAVRQLHPR